jgi:hypothetical protein
MRYAGKDEKDEEFVRPSREVRYVATCASRLAPARSERRKARGKAQGKAQGKARGGNNIPLLQDLCRHYYGTGMAAYNGDIHTYTKAVMHARLTYMCHVLGLWIELRIGNRISKSQTHKPANPQYIWLLAISDFEVSGQGAGVLKVCL